MTQPIEPRLCLNCGEPLVRKTYRRFGHGYLYNQLEHFPKFLTRKYCGNDCKQSHIFRTLWADESFREKMTTVGIITPQLRQRRRENMRQSWADGTQRAYVATIKRRTTPDWNGLTDEQVREIIIDPRRYQDIGHDYNISPNMVSAIKLGKTYKIENPPEPVMHRKVKKSKTPRKRISDAEVQAIIADTGNYRSIAAKYGVSSSYVGKLKTGNKKSTRRASLPDLVIQAIVAAPEPYRVIAANYGISLSYVAKLKKRASEALDNLSLAE